MTPEELIAEGRRLQRPCMFLRPTGSGEVAAVWYEPETRTGYRAGYRNRCWLTVDARFISGLSPSVTGFITVFTGENDHESGRIAFTPSWPKQSGTPLYASPASVLPPIDAVFARGSHAVESWIISHGWERNERYNYNFKDKAIVDEYEKVWRSEHPLFRDSNIYATLGGWHMTWPDHDWHDLIDKKLLVFTLRDAEPWFEAWQMGSDDFEVILRCT
jgi:hypothetical protein